MLENAGAIVYAPRERDPQTYEAIVDNDQPGRYGTYEEWNTAKYAWQTAEGRGFSAPLTTYNSQNMPFEMGTARCVPTTREHNEHATATWTPLIPKRGRYAVYVSYASLPNSVSDASLHRPSCRGRNVLSCQSAHGRRHVALPRHVPF